MVQPLFIREAPAAMPLAASGADPTHPDVRTGKPHPEPILRVGDIQGNILGGFNKDHQTMVYLRIADAAPFKAWLAEQVDFVATAAEVIAFNRLFKTMRARRHREGYVQSTWFNLAFSYEGLCKLTESADAFTDAAFREGLRRRSPLLGDPTDGTPGDPANWLVGGPEREADVVLIVAADTRADRDAELERLSESLVRFPGSVEILLIDEAANLPPPITGHEHFGFLDGISQPGIRGVVSNDPTDVLTPRQNPAEPIDQGKPGQDVLWPGEFVFGYESQDREKDIAEPGADSLTESGPDGGPAGPDWARDGSYLVIRRLHQDVAGFHTFLKRTAEELGIEPPENSSEARYVGSRLVGRWPSGCPVLRSPNADNFLLGNDDCANNNFEFGGAAPAPVPHQGDQCAEGFPTLTSPGDPQGVRCPFTGHIRKTYPRDDESNDKSADPDVPGCGSRQVLGESDTQTHRLLRRGIPYGPVSPSSPDAPVADTIDRGLQFLAYQTSIEDQFEFVIRCWVNNADFKEPSGPGGGGHDPILGQNPGGEREFDLPFPVDRDNRPTRPPVRIKTRENWVWATGGGYFFAPSIPALRNELSGKGDAS